MLKIDYDLILSRLQEKIQRFWPLSAQKILLIEQELDTKQGAPVFTRQGKYTSRGWTEWTQGFQYGSALQTTPDDAVFLEIGKTNTIEKMPIHVS
ncbi:MAG: hypothetical protein U5R06_13110 [candidate division KSB1 bacterium]|nr:hypothetical protein [candidate division KSB1 bacterium]